MLMLFRECTYKSTQIKRHSRHVNQYQRVFKVNLSIVKWYIILSNQRKYTYIFFLRFLFIIVIMCMLKIDRKEVHKNETYLNAYNYLSIDHLLRYIIVLKDFNQQVLISTAIFPPLVTYFCLLGADSLGLLSAPCRYLSATRPYLINDRDKIHHFTSNAH